MRSSVSVHILPHNLYQARPRPDPWRPQLERVQITAWAILILSLVTLPLSITLSETYPAVFLLISAVWLLSPIFFTGNRALFNLCLAFSLFFVTLYVRALTVSALAQLDPGRLAIYHIEQGITLLVLFLLARHFFSLSMLRITRQGLARAVIFGLAIGLPFGVVDHLSGEKIVPMPELGFSCSILWIVSLSILVGMLEELLFRGVMYRPAREVVGPRFAAIFQALLFSMMHYPNPASALAAAVLFGVIMVYLVEKTGNLFAPGIAHMSNNTIWMILGRFGGIRF